MANLPSLFRQSPFRELNRMQRQIDRLFTDMMGAEEFPITAEQPEFMPPVDVDEADSHYVLSFDLPGVKKEDLHIELTGNELCVWGERKQEHEERTKSRYRMERSYGEFSRTFTLPEGIKAEHIQSDYHDGVLHIAIPKMKAPEEKGHQIQIGAGEPGFFQRLLGHRAAEGTRPGMEVAEKKKEKGGKVA
jgi:HSP20 family protein